MVVLKRDFDGWMDGWMGGWDGMGWDNYCKNKFVRLPLEETDNITVT